MNRGDRRHRGGAFTWHQVAEARALLRRAIAALGPYPPSRAHRDLCAGLAKLENILEQIGGAA